MMNEIKIFDNAEFGRIRTLTLDGEPWFVGKDVAEKLGYKDTKNAIKDHVDNDDKLMGCQNTTPYIIDSRGRKQYPTFVNESGVYALVFGSKLPSAKRFKRWVTSEVLPALRKTGQYSVQEQRTLTKDDYIRAASIVAGCRNERLPYVLSLLEQGGFSIPEIEPSKQEENDGVASVILNLMQTKGISLNQLSDMVQIPKSSLSYYTRGKLKIPKQRYTLIIEALS